MEHDITTSGDGSSTLQLTCYNETYHSRNGAYTEARHIYIHNGLEHLFQTAIHGAVAVYGAAANEAPCVDSGVDSGIAGTTNGAAAGCLNIFDVGFGTGLNCILAWVWQQQRRLQSLPFPRICYCGIEKYPIPLSEIQQLNYHNIIAEKAGFIPDKSLADAPAPPLHKKIAIRALAESVKETFLQMHNSPWEEDISIGEDSFILHKSRADIAAVTAQYYREAKYSAYPALVLYDTFSPATQPELWDETIFRTIASGCAPGTILLTYCSKGTVKQALRNAGFTIERLAGPPGKRHILRAAL